MKTVDSSGAVRAHVPINVPETIPPAPEASRADVGMSFGEALWAVRAGARIARRGWNGKGMSLELQVPDAHSKMTLPYLFMHTASGDRVPWLASQTDILAADWYLA